MHREIDGFYVWAGASKDGEESKARAHIETKRKDGQGETRIFTIITDRVFARLEEAQDFANDAVTKVQSVDEDGVPSPLVF